ncbi:MAG TPA: hypothetical protein VHP14_02830 [Anaerolineales bacterium]|nr:hypothetical protein [Anaerolineales bacterium]
MSLHTPRHIKASPFLFGLMLLLFAPILYSHSFLITADDLTDFHKHMLWAVSLGQDGLRSMSSALLAHSAWQFLLVLFHKAFGGSYESAQFLAAVLSFELTAFVLFFWYRPVFYKTDRPDWQIMVVVLGVCIVAPVSLLWYWDGAMYLGYIGITSYHNPTIILMKPFAVLQFIFACQCFYETRLVKNWQIILSAAVSSLCTFIKPNFAICILPALAVFSVYCILKRKYLNYKALFWGLILPTVTVLGWQFVLTYYDDQSSAVIFLPLVVMSVYSRYLGWKFLLSILFPIGLLTMYFKQAVRDVRMILAWLIFLIGAVFTYFFAESGPRLLDGNFVWCGEIASLMLFAVSTLFYFDIFSKNSKSAKLLAGLWSLHVIFGILYYFCCMFSGSYH